LLYVGYYFGLNHGFYVACFLLFMVVVYMWGCSVDMSWVLWLLLIVVVASRMCWWLSWLLNWLLVKLSSRLFILCILVIMLVFCSIRLFVMSLVVLMFVFCCWV